MYLRITVNGAPPHVPAKYERLQSTFLLNDPATSLNSLRILRELVAFKEFTNFAMLGVFGDVDINR